MYPTRRLATEEKIAKILTLAVNTAEDVKDIDIRLGRVEAAVKRYTTQLTELASDMKTLLDEKIVADARFERLENWVKRVGDKNRAQTPSCKWQQQQSWADLWPGLLRC